MSNPRFQLYSVEIAGNLARHKLDVTVAIYGLQYNNPDLVECELHSVKLKRGNRSREVLAFLDDEQQRAIWAEIEHEDHLNYIEWLEGQEH